MAFTRGYGSDVGGIGNRKGAISRALWTMG